MADDLEELSLPTSVVRLKSGAFSFCYGLRSVILPHATRIGRSGFSDCPWISSVTLSGSVQIVDRSALERLVGASILISGNLPTIECDYLVRRQVEIVRYLGHSGTVFVDETKKIVGPACLSGLSSLEAIQFALPSKIYRIASMPFNECSSLKSIVIPRSVLILRHRSFFSCVALRRVVFEQPSGLTHIKDETYMEDIYENRPQRQPCGRLPYETFVQNFG
jgi:hypothetical protein